MRMGDGGLWAALAVTVVLLVLLMRYIALPSPEAGIYHTKTLTEGINSMAAPTTRYITAFCTVPSQEVASRIAKALVQQRVAACVNTIPGLESTYWWEGKVETDQELLLMIKTREELVGDVVTTVKANHPYDVPEIIAMNIVGGNAEYLKWISESTSSS